MKPLLVILSLIFSAQVFAQSTTKSTYRECTITTVEERVSADGVKVHQSRSSSIGVTERFFDSSKPGWTLSLFKGDTKFERMRPDGNVWETTMESSIERKNESTTTELGNDLYRDVVHIEAKRNAKPGYDFGTNPDGSKITYKESQFDYDSTYFDDGRFTYGVSDRVDGVDVPVQKIIYEYSTHQEGDVTVMVQRLVEPYVYPEDPNIKYVSEETVCRSKKLN